MPIVTLVIIALLAFRCRHLAGTAYLYKNVPIALYNKQRTDTAQKMLAIGYQRGRRQLKRKRTKKEEVKGNASSGSFLLGF